MNSIADRESIAWLNRSEWKLPPNIFRKSSPNQVPINPVILFLMFYKIAEIWKISFPYLKLGQELGHMKRTWSYVKGKNYILQIAVPCFCNVKVHVVFQSHGLVQFLIHKATYNKCTCTQNFSYIYRRTSQHRGTQFQHSNSMGEILRRGA